MAKQSQFDDQFDLHIVGLAGAKVVAIEVVVAVMVMGAMAMAMVAMVMGEELEVVMVGRKINLIEIYDRRTLL